MTVRVWTVSSLSAGRLWSNMLVFWLQKIVAVDSSGQSRVYGVAGAGAGGRDTWEKHKQVWLLRH